MQSKIRVNITGLTLDSNILGAELNCICRILFRRKKIDIALISANKYIFQQKKIDMTFILIFNWQFFLLQFNAEFKVFIQFAYLRNYD